jgi:hypothetical protein
MDPQNNPTNPSSGLSLPPVDQNQTSAAQPAVQAQPAAPAPAQQTPAAVPPPNPTTDDESPLIADDADLIEKAWVEKAKQLVEQTKNDPHKQNEEINRFKATYIKKRYNKDIQLNEN